MGTRIVAGIMGVGIIAAGAHYSILCNGGYNWVSAPLFIALAMAIIGGAVVAGSAESRAIGIGLVLCMFAAEGYQLTQTAERTAGMAEARQAPLREAVKTRQKAIERVSEAEAAIARLDQTPRLSNAVEAKKAADETVRNDAAKSGCARNCRALLEQQVAESQKEVDAARAEIEQAQAAARQELDQARTALALLPAAASATPLADRTGIAQWKIDIASALLISLGLNGSGALLTAFCFERRRHDVVEVVESTAFRPANPRNATNEARQFVREMFRPVDGARVNITTIWRAYHEWCAENGLEPLDDEAIAKPLKRLFEAAGLAQEGAGSRAAIVGIDLTADVLTIEAAS